MAWAKIGETKLTLQTFNMWGNLCGNVYNLICSGVKGEYPHYEYRFTTYGASSIYRDRYEDFFFTPDELEEGICRFKGKITDLTEARPLTWEDKARYFTKDSRLIYLEELVIGNKYRIKINNTEIIGYYHGIKRKRYFFGDDKLDFTNGFRYTREEILKNVYEDIK